MRVRIRSQPMYINGLIFCVWSNRCCSERFRALSSRGFLRFQLRTQRESVNFLVHVKFRTFLCLLSCCLQNHRAFVIKSENEQINGLIALNFLVMKCHSEDIGIVCVIRILQSQTTFLCLCASIFIDGRQFSCSSLIKFYSTRRFVKVISQQQAYALN